MMPVLPGWDSSMARSRQGSIFKLYFAARTFAPSRPPSTPFSFFRFFPSIRDTPLPSSPETDIESRRGWNERVHRKRRVDDASNVQRLPNVLCSRYSLMGRVKRRNTGSRDGSFALVNIAYHPLNCEKIVGPAYL